MNTSLLPAVSFAIPVTPGSSALSSTGALSLTALAGPIPLLQTGNVSGIKLFASQPPLEGPPPLDPVGEEFSGAFLSADLLLTALAAAVVVTGGVALWKHLQSPNRKKPPNLDPNSHLEQILEKTRQADFRIMPAHHYLDIDNARLAVPVGLGILQLWQDRLPSQAADQRWSLVLTMNQPFKGLPPEFRIIVTSKNEIMLGPHEDDLAIVNEKDIASGLTLPSVDEVLTKVQALTRQ